MPTGPRLHHGEGSFAGWKEVHGDLPTFLLILKFSEDALWQQANETAHLVKIT